MQKNLQLASLSQSIISSIHRWPVVEGQGNSIRGTKVENHDGKLLTWPADGPFNMRQPKTRKYILKQIENDQENRKISRNQNKYIYLHNVFQ